MATGSVAVFSPVALTSDVKAKVASLGTLKYIVAPDFEHHIFVKPWALEYPQAEVIGVEGLPEKREADPDTKGTEFPHVFTLSNKRDVHISPEFDDEFEYEYVDAHQNKELVFLHKSSKTLIEADFILNLPATEQFSKTGISATSGILTKLFASVTNTRGDAVWQRRLIWYALGGKNRKGFAESVNVIKKWDFDRIIPCHGDVIETGGKDVFNNVFRWFAEGNF
jgi:hypothetical protein